MDYEQIRQHVINESGFKRHYNLMLNAPYSTDDISEGVRYASTDAEFTAQCSDAVRRFYNCDYGTFYLYDEHPTEGQEYGEYETKFGVVWVHREAVAPEWHKTAQIIRTCIMFPFEH